MEYRQLGQSEIQLSSITFGAWAIGGWMWGGADKRDAGAAGFPLSLNETERIDAALQKLVLDR